MTALETCEPAYDEGRTAFLRGEPDSDRYVLGLAFHILRSQSQEAEPCESSKS